MGCDFPMGAGATYSVWMKGEQGESNDPSDRVTGLHTRHKDEAPGNTWGHNSFYVVFQRTRKGPSVLDQNAMLQAHAACGSEQMGGGSPFAVYARDSQPGSARHAGIQRRRVPGARLRRGCRLRPSRQRRRRRPRLVVT